MADDRRDELLGAALADDLTGAERAELEALLRDDPRAREELEGAMAVVRALAGARRPGAASDDGAWGEVEPPAGLHERVLAATSGAADGPPVTAAAPAPGAEGLGVVLPLRRQRPRAGGRRRAALTLAACALVLLGLGAVGGLVLADRLDRPPQGPPGTLGALEPVVFTSVPEGVTVSAAVVAHTWGTETVIEEVSGLTPGRTYEVVLRAADGTEVGTGSFEAVAGAVDCRMTSATKREEVAAVSVREADGAEVMTSALPQVAAA